MSYFRLHCEKSIRGKKQIKRHLMWHKIHKWIPIVRWLNTQHNMFTNSIKIKNNNIIKQYWKLQIYIYI